MSRTNKTVRSTRSTSIANTQTATPPWHVPAPSAPPSVASAGNGNGNGAGKTVIVNFKLERETKNTFVYAEVPPAGQPNRIGALYLQKWPYTSAPQTFSIPVPSN